MSTSIGETKHRHRGSVKLQELLSLLHKPSKPDLRMDPLNAISNYLDRTARIQDDVQELAMHLAADKAIKCQVSADTDMCDVTTEDGCFYGNWKLVYSSELLLRIAMGVADIHQSIRPARNGERGGVIRTIWGDQGGCRFAVEGEISALSNHQALNKFPYQFKRSLLFLSTRLCVPLPPPTNGGCLGVLFSDGEMRVDWDGSGAVNVYAAYDAVAEKEQKGPECQTSAPPSGAGLAAHLLAQVGGFIGAQKRQDALGVWMTERKSASKESSTSKEDEAPASFAKVPGIKLDWLLQNDNVTPRALALALFFASSSAANAVTQLVAEDQAVQALIEPKEPISNSLAVALVSPLIAYKAASLARGEKLLPQLDFVILASVCALCAKIGGYT